MFTIADICNIAVQIEKNGEETYRKAAESCNDAEMVKIFTKMADDEKKHAQWFESLRIDKELTEEQREMEAIGKSLLQEMVKDKTFSLDGDNLPRTENLETLFHLSQGFEKDTILFYEMLGGFIDDQETLSHLHAIIAEEQSHFEELAAMAENFLTEA